MLLHTIFRRRGGKLAILVFLCCYVLFAVGFFNYQNSYSSLVSAVSNNEAFSNRELKEEIKSGSQDYSNLWNTSFPRTTTPHNRARHFQNPRNKVFILSLPRSGSSLTALTLNFTRDGCARKPPQWQAPILKDLFEGNCTSMRDFTNSVAVELGEYYSWDHITAASPKASLCIPSENDTPEINKQRNDASIAIKEIFWWNSKLNWLYDTIGSDLKLIWLVRDVRGWASSFLQDLDGELMYRMWHYHETDFWERYRDCEGLSEVVEPARIGMLEELLLNMSAPPHKRLAAVWTVDTLLTKYYLQNYPGQFILLQYEHLGLYPYEVTQQIYNFLGHPITNEQVVRWLSKSTEEGDENLRYSTSRNSAKMASIWLKRLSMEQLIEIEEIVGDELLDFFEYPRVADLVLEQK